MINKKKSSKKKKSSSDDHHKDSDSENQIQNKGNLIADATIAGQEIKFPIKNWFKFEINRKSIKILLV